MMPAQSCVDEARKYLGVKWRHRGRKAWALDCIGLVVRSVRAGGAAVKDRTNYGREPWRDGLRDALEENFGKPVDEWEVGDIALMRRPDQLEPSHVGIISNYAHGGFSLIHCHSQIAVTEHRLDDFWRHLILAVYRPAWPHES